MSKKGEHKGSQWTAEREEALAELVHKLGTKKWAVIVDKMKIKFPGFNQNPKQCRERWRNHLDPRVNKDPWTPDEELMFIEKHKIYGNKWSEIGKFLNGRNDNAVKNYFYSSVRKIIRKVSLK